MASNLSKPIVKESSKSNGYNIDIKEAESPDFGKPNINAKNQKIIQQSSPPIPPIPNQSQLSQMASNLSKPIVKESSKSNGYNIDIKEAESPDFDQPINNAKNQENIQQSSTQIPSIPNQSQLSQMASNLSKPIVKESSKSNGYNIDIKEAESPDFDQPNINAKNQKIIQQSSPPIPPIPNQSQLSQMASNLSKPIVKESSKSNGYDIDIKEAESPDFGKPNINAKNQKIIQQSSPPIPPIPNQSQLTQMASNLSKPIVKESSKSNGYNIDIKEAESPDFDQPINNAKNQENIQQSSTQILSIPNQSQLSQMASNLSKPIVKESSKSNGYDIDIKEAESPDFDQPINNAKNQENIQQSSTQILSIPNQSQLSQMASNLSKPLVKESSKSNGYNIDIKEAESPDFGKPNINAKNQKVIQQSSPPIPPIPNQSQLSQMASNLSKPIVKESSKCNGYDIDIKEAESPDFDQPINNAKNQENIQQSSTQIHSIPNQSQLSQMASNLSKPLVKESSKSNGYNIDIKEAESPDFGKPNINAKNQKIIQQSSPPIPPIPNQSQLSQMASNFQNQYNSKNQENVQQSSPPISSIPNQFQLSKPIVKESFTPNGYDIEIKEKVPYFGQPISNSKNQENVQQSSPPISSIPNQFQLSKPIVKESFTPNGYDIEIKEEAPDFGLPINNAKNQENVQQSSPSNEYDTDIKEVVPDFDQVINNADKSTENQQNTSNEDSLSENVEDTELNEESKLEKAMSESLIVALDDNDTENDELYTLGNLVLDVPPSELDRISNYDTSFIVDTENPKNVKEDNAKITVYANPNDVHILQLSPKQSSTNDNSYLINDNLLNAPSTRMPLWYSSFPNGADYVQHFNSNTNKQLSNSFFNFNQNPAYNQIPMNLENSNYFNQQAAVDQNLMTSKIQSPGLSLDDNQPSSMDSSGSIYKKVDLKNIPPNSSNSWSLLKKDYTKNLQPNQNDRYTSGDGTTRTSFFGTPLSSYQNSNQGILNLPSNDMFVQNMISVISNSVQAPVDGTKAIFDITSANFPRSSVSHIIRLTHAIVRSVMLNLRQTLNTFMKTLYGHRVKRDFNPFEVLHNLPGALVNKYSLQSTAAPTTKNINSPYYNQPTTADQTTAALFAGQQTTADYSMSQSVTKNMLGQQQAYGNEIDRNYYGSQNNNIGVVPQPASTQNYVLNSLTDAITSAVRSNVPAPYSIDSPEVKQYTQQVILTAEIVFKNQIDNILYGQSPTLNMY
ncbi:hypothetical protein AGLY_000854 [Aphis glycines]|uniref:Uncharacterized protein n=1 Tax=Aphis glycines TaxID=307491 RepID=A0A6G0U856_APHGL|nr:hypothetical protein AGLY_000854 [Aphis glycines]